MKVGLVVPSNRPARLAEFKEAWKPYIENEGADYSVTPYYIEDNSDTWESIKADLGPAAWIIPVRTDCIRSYGFLQAFRDGCDVTITLDDDVKPMNNAIQAHIDALNNRVEPSDWVRTLRGDNCPPTRGLPLVRTTVINHGLWTGVPDVTAETQLKGYRKDYLECDSKNEQVVPRGAFYPMSGMNLAFDTRITRFMYFTLQGSRIHDPYGEPWGLHRCGDILAGVLSKSVIDKLPFMAVRSGSPYVYHERASDPNVNLTLEANTYDLPWHISERVKRATSYRGCAEALFHLHIDGISMGYFRHLSLAMRQWYDLCKGEPGEYSRPNNVASRGPIQEPEDAASNRQGLEESEVVS